MKKYLPVLFVLCLAISACSSGTKSPTLIGTWKLTSYGPVDSPVPAVPDAEASLTFNSDGTVTGNSGCNGLGGDYEVGDDQITFGPIMSTLMACDGLRMEQEGSVHRVMTETASYRIDGNILTIAKGDTVLVFESAVEK